MIAHSRTTVSVLAALGLLCTLERPASAQIPTVKVLNRPTVGQLITNPNSTRISVVATGNATSQNLNFWVLNKAATPSASYKFVAKFSPSQKSSAGNWIYRGDLPLLDNNAFPRGGTAQFLVFLDDGTYLDLLDSAGRVTGYSSLVLQAQGSVDSNIDYLTANAAHAFQNEEETVAYYGAVNDVLAAAGYKRVVNLSDFQGNFPATAHARYYNRGDLGTGRDMHCGLRPTRDVGCYVSNIGPIDVDPPFADFVGSELAMNTGGLPFATVAMFRIAATGNVYFMVFGRDGQLVNRAALDNQHFVNGPQNLSIPGNCLSCHVGTSKVDGRDKGAFLPFDLSNFEFRSGFPQATQESSFTQLNNFVLTTLLKSPAAAVINAWYADGNAKYNGNNLPTGWQPTPNLSPSSPDYVPAFAKSLYLNTVKPYCLTCHMTQPQFPFTSYKNFMGFASLVGVRACDRGATMPNARATAVHWWRGIDDTDEFLGQGTGKITAAGRAHLVAAFATNGLAATTCKGNAGNEICAKVPENSRATLTCPPGEKQTFVSAHYGTPNGVCGGFSAGSCDATSARARAVACDGAQSCVLNSNNFTYGDPCPGTGKSLAVDVICQPEFSLEVCGVADENNTLTLTCPEGKISGVRLVSYGTPSGTCRSAQTVASCHASNSSSVVLAACTGKTSCTINVNNTTFGDPCAGKAKRLIANVSCTR